MASLMALVNIYADTLTADLLGTLNAQVLCPNGISVVVTGIACQKCQVRDCGWEGFILHCIQHFQEKHPGKDWKIWSDPYTYRTPE